MNTNEPPRMKADEAGFAAALVVTLLLIVPSLPFGKYGGGVAMIAVAAMGLLTYFVLFGERLRRRGQLKMAAGAAVLAAAIAVGITLLTRGLWR
jgi:hypothetical protein